MLHLQPEDGAPDWHSGYGSPGLRGRAIAAAGQGKVWLTTKSMALLPRQHLAAGAPAATDTEHPGQAQGAPHVGSLQLSLCLRLPPPLLHLCLLSLRHTQVFRVLVKT
jgi:hypothetical protein